MRKMIRLMAVAIAAVAMAACGRKTSSPEEAAEAFLKSYQKGDYAAMVDQMYFKQQLTDEEKKEYVAIFEAKITSELDEKGGIASYEIGETEKAEDGQTAKVSYTITYGDGSNQPQKMDLILVDGEWRPSSGK
ncbi:MAG: DUF4878 domain-containing protein [Paludibacteraceae bacterium]|nr:DUF4878 domain-containing protein [Paludibacteraceae bacterium]